MPAIIAVLLLALAFGLGRCSVDEESAEYRVIHDTKTVTKTVRVPSDMPLSCRQAADVLPRLQQATEDLDVYAGRLGDIAQDVGTFADQPNGQREINDRLMEARDLQSKTARIGQAALAAQRDYNDLAARCAADMKGE